MSRTKELLVKGMNKVMLSCDTATLLIVKSDYVPLKCTEKIRLQMHLLTCKFCRRFKKQSDFINLQIQKLNTDFTATDLSLHLSEEQKQRILQAITEIESQENNSGKDNMNHSL